MDGVGSGAWQAREVSQAWPLSRVLWLLLPSSPSPCPGTEIYSLACVGNVAPLQGRPPESDAGTFKIRRLGAGLGKTGGKYYNFTLNARLLWKLLGQAVEVPAGGFRDILGCCSVHQALIH